MNDIERICEKIREEKDNIVAKAFTCQIASLLLTNGIVPIMSEYSKKDLEEITDANRYQLVYELGVTFDSLDTSRHDAKVRAETISEISREMRVLYENEYENKIRIDAIEEYNLLLKEYFVIPHDIQVIDIYAKQLKERYNEN